MACFHRCVPESSDKLKIRVKAFGRAAYAHFSNLYPTPLGPRADVSAAVRNASVILLEEISGHHHSGSGGQSPCCEGCT